jgi:uncharacterized protein YjeT (DUF2065 family)
MTELFAALGVALVIEGAAYALFPQHMRRMVALLVTQPEGVVRLAGLGAALAGLLCVIVAKGLP